MTKDQIERDLKIQALLRDRKIIKEEIERKKLINEKYPIADLHGKLGSISIKMNKINSDFRKAQGRE